MFNPKWSFLNLICVYISSLDSGSPIFFLKTTESLSTIDMGFCLNFIFFISFMLIFAMMGKVNLETYSKLLSHTLDNKLYLSGKTSSMIGYLLTLTNMRRKKEGNNQWYVR